MLMMTLENSNHSKSQRSLSDFRAEILKIHGHRKHRISHSIGVYDIYKQIRKNKWMGIERPLLEGEFYSIIREYNKLFAEEFQNGGSIIFPCRMGNVELRRYSTSLKFKDGKLVTNMPVDWDATLKLWNEDAQSLKDKILIRHEVKDVYRIIYNKNKALYNNKMFVDFYPNRTMKRTLNYNINDDKIDAYEMGRSALWRESAIYKDKC